MLEDLDLSKVKLDPKREFKLAELQMMLKKLERKDLERLVMQYAHLYLAQQEAISNLSKHQFFDKID